MTRLVRAVQWVIDTAHYLYTSYHPLQDIRTYRDWRKL